MTKQQKPQITERAERILADVVNSYSQTGQPVGSKVLVETSKLNLSPASVRNVMQDLEKQGLLTHPHTSAGRIPTEEGFRYYATNLVEVDDLDSSVKKELKAKVTSGKNISDIITDVSDVVGEITGCASLVVAPKKQADPLEQVEFIRLSGDRVLVVIVTAGGEIENRVINVPAFIDTKELNNASKEMKKFLAGQTLDQAREQMIEAIAEQRGRVNEMIDQMMAAANEWGQPTVSDGAMVVAGSTNLFQYPEIVREKLQNLVKIFEEKRLLMALMEEVKHGDGVRIYIGKDSPVSKAGDCSVVASSYGCKSNNIIGTLGVIGPMRMDYKKTIGIVNYTSKLLTSVLQEGTN
ncbi:MAG: heat-inducible transcriptional repressor HrcA [Alphaproteobacteria bacterium]|nr:heat-inducible transcriptional repressor HrcA [Alphaproteobacteria bacterium]MDD9919348.1 heat-inducible transcriptional repressor HrcA [Alphaproteobacteria bacterium]